MQLGSEVTIISAAYFKKCGKVYKTQAEHLQYLRMPSVIN